MLVLSKLLSHATKQHCRNVDYQNVNVRKLHDKNIIDFSASQSISACSILMAAPPYWHKYFIKLGIRVLILRFC